MDMFQRNDKRNKLSTYTKGNVIVQDIKIGDVHYEYEMTFGIKCQVVSQPKLNEIGQWVWQSKNLKTGEIINYLVDPKCSQYSANLFDYEAYPYNTYI